ncbi:TonB-dependent receptor plug domain-containing protein [Aquabacterium sp.]|uniref:TonB-dependent receptor plug domain-containing protein n=1 Tax=Aquabacterium sp. TaxID=1872578 RepID=UPI002BFE5E82|nr:TonB-dependent receptor [Aquabacterium sp.]HSW05428.1 TonB-dependent receptor [Aquabacterium sp.]
MLACAALADAHAAERALVDLSFEELATLEITSVSRRTERLSDAAASVYVITADAIRRSGASSLPQVLRLAPNLQVAQTDASQFAISARGFNNTFGNKLLVLVDGRTVYAPVFSGVFWDQQDLVLEDIERIEVISGPGATLWGANAVNGVINVITRAAQGTQGPLLVAEGGEKEALLALRFGGTLPADGHFRVYAKRTQRQNTRTESGTAIPDGWDHQQVGFRADWAGARDSLTLQGDAYEGQGDESRRAFGVLVLAPTEVSGVNLLGRWVRRWADGSSLRVQAYYDHSTRDDALLYRPTVDIADLELQHSLQLASHKLVWGGGYRRSSDDIQPGLFFGFHPAQRTLHWTNVFVQDEIGLTPTLDLTLGAKLEHNDYTGTESLPSARLAWKPANDHLLWAAWSRAVRAPARLDHDMTLPPRPPFFIAGGPDFISEVANVVELGWRAQPAAGFSFSATLFHHRWDRLRSGQPAPNALVQNMIDGSTQGLEAWALWQLSPRWRMSAGATVLHHDLRIKPGSTDPVGPSALGNDPKRQWQLRSSFNPAPGHELDIGVRRVSALPNPAVPAYTAVDLRYGWHLSDDLSFALIGQNLFDPGHAEFNAAPDRSEMARSLRLQLRWAW